MDFNNTLKNQEFSQEIINQGEALLKDLEKDILLEGNDGVKYTRPINNSPKFINSLFFKLIGNRNIFLYCFQENKELIIAFLRTFILGKHKDFLEFYNDFNEDIKKELINASVYDPDKLLSNSFDFSEKGFLGILNFDLKNNLERDIKFIDYYGNLSDKEFSSIVYEIGIGIHDNNFIMQNYSLYNPFFYKKLFQVKNINDNLKIRIYNFYFKENKRSKVFIESLIKRDDIENIGMLKYLFETDIEILLTTSFVQESTKTVISNDQEESPQESEKSQEKDSYQEVANLIISQEKKEYNGMLYNLEGYKILINLPYEKQKKVVQHIINQDFNELIYLLRNRGIHVANKRNIEIFDIDTIIKILKSGLYDLENIDINILLEVDQFSILKAVLLLEFDKLVKILNALEVDEIKKIIYILFLLKDEKEYPIKNFRHICKDKEENIDSLKINLAVQKIKKENEHIYKWYVSEIAGEEIIDINSFDYNYLRNYLETNGISLNIENIINKIVHNFRNIASDLVYENIFDIKDAFTKSLTEKSDITFQKIIFFYSELENKYKKLLLKSDEEILNKIEESLKLLKDITIFLGKKDFIDGNIKKLKIVNEILNENKTTKGQIKLITSYEQLNYLNGSEIVVLKDYPSNFGDYFNKQLPKAIIISKEVSDFSHAIQFSQKKGIPCFYLPFAEKYFKYANGLDIEINQEGEIVLDNNGGYFTYYDDIDTKFLGNKARGIIEENDIISISGNIFYKVLTDYYGEITTEEYQEKIKLYEKNKTNIRRGEIDKNEFLEKIGLSFDLNEVLYLPYEHLKNIIDNIVDYKNIDYQALSKQIYSILDSISIKDEHINEIFQEKKLDFPLALRSDFLFEDDNQRTPGLKESYLNIRNIEELKKYLLEMIKQDFSPQALKYKVENNIYILNSTFGAVLQEMIIKKEEQAENMLSGVFKITKNNGEYEINGDLALGLNAGITSGNVKGINTSLDKKISYNQEKIITIDEENGGLKIINKNLNLNLDIAYLNNLKTLILKYVGDLEEQEEAQIEFSILDYNDLKEENFRLLQKNIFLLKN